MEGVSGHGQERQRDQDPKEVPEVVLDEAFFVNFHYSSSPFLFFLPAGVPAGALACDGAEGPEGASLQTKSTTKSVRAALAGLPAGS